MERTTRSTHIGVNRGLTLAALIGAIAATMFAAAGDLDLTFDHDGKVIVDFGGNLDDQANAIKYYAASTPLNGKLIVAGSANGSTTSESSNFGLTRLTTIGALDTSFGGTGKVSTDFSGHDDWAYAVVIQPDDKV